MAYGKRCRGVERGEEGSAGNWAVQLVIVIAVVGCDFSRVECSRFK